jgi:hypothetical protein
VWRFWAGVFSDAVEFLALFFSVMLYFLGWVFSDFLAVYFFGFWHFAEFCQFLPFHFCVFWVFFVAGLLFGSFFLCRLFFIFQRLLIRL